MNQEQLIQNKNTFLNYCKQYINREGIDDLLKYLEKTDFFTAPSSISFHLNEDGGLCRHSLNVFETAMKLYDSILSPAIDSNISPFTEKPSLESVAISTQLHDLCKTKLYHKVEKWKKDENNRWVSYPGWEINDEFPFGHGDKSCVIISWFMRLKQDELLAIRWHMGMFDTGEPGSSSRYAMQAAMGKSPLVTLVQVSDLLSANCLEKTTNWKDTI